MSSLTLENGDNVFCEDEDVLEEIREIIEAGHESMKYIGKIEWKDEKERLKERDNRRDDLHVKEEVLDYLKFKNSVEDLNSILRRSGTFLRDEEVLSEKEVLTLYGFRKRSSDFFRLGEEILNLNHLTVILEDEDYY